MIDLTDNGCSIVPHIMVVENEGMPKPNTGGLEKGNLFVLFNILFPTNVDNNILSSILSQESSTLDNDTASETVYLAPSSYDQFGKSNGGGGGGGRGAGDDDDEECVQQCQQS